MRTMAAKIERAIRLPSASPAPSPLTSSDISTLHRLLENGEAVPEFRAPNFLKWIKESARAAHGRRPGDTPALGGNAGPDQSHVSGTHEIGFEKNARCACRVPERSERREGKGARLRSSARDAGPREILKWQVRQ